MRWERRSIPGARDRRADGTRSSALTSSLAAFYKTARGIPGVQAEVARTRSPIESRPVARRPTATPTGIDEQIETSFRRFRESAVRLVEQVNDRLGPNRVVTDGGQADLHLIRSIFGKWSADILLSLHHTPSAGFEDLRRTLGGISARVLSIKLKELEEIGLVTREIIDARPPRVRYSLTERGWTVAWLAQPIFLYVRLTTRLDARPTPPAEPSTPAAGDPSGALIPPTGTATGGRSRSPSP